MVQAVAALANYRTHYRCIPDDRSETYNDYHRVQICKNRNYFRGGKIQKTKVEGTQRVFGVQVPSGMILTRHSKTGSVGVTGNCTHINLGHYIFTELINENPEIWTPEFQNELRNFMAEGIALEKEFVRDCLPDDIVGMRQQEFLDYVELNANRRLVACKLEPLGTNKNNPFPWLDEVINLRKEKNFFETRVTEYQMAGSMKNSSEDDLI
jgi:ribonucleotide reductase beta subunit family protein with ferritin-like domain